ncbi:HEAT repeat domain-containing protein, partial [Streptomyces sp. NPDC056061]|uniref:HEAT repeat domain-containing protein n=1 Tax=Streptomyces sp. NPDC056061 TaxID=3345700 RepID=UPI0035D758AC
MECSGAAGVLSPIAEGAEHEDDRYEALGALLVLGSADLPAVLSHALRDPSAKVRVLAAGAARRNAAAGPWAPLSETVLVDPSPAVRSAAAESLAGGPDEAREPLARALLLDPDRAVRLTAARSLASFGDDAAPHLIQALADHDARVRRAAVIGLRSATTPEAVLALRTLGGVERDEEVRAELVDLLTASARSGGRGSRDERESPDGQGPRDRWESRDGQGPRDGWGPRDREAARLLFDPGARSRAFTSWLRDLARYPTSAGVIFYATGYVRVVAEATAGALYAFRVPQDGLLRITLPERPDFRTGFSVTEEQFTDAYGASRGRYRLTLEDFGPPFRQEEGPVHFYCLKR